MVVERLLKATVIAPASQAQNLLTALLRFGDFHPLSRDDLRLAAEIEPLYEKARRLFLELEALARELEVEPDGGVIEILLRGEPEPERIDVKDVEELLESLSRRADPLLLKVRTINERLEAIRPEIERLEREMSRLTTYVELGLNLSILPRLKHVYASAFVANIRDIREIAASLEEAFVTYRPISRENALLLVVTNPKHQERLERILRTFKLVPLEVEVEESLDKMRERLKAVEEELTRLKSFEESLILEKRRVKVERGKEIATLRLLARDALETLQRVRGVSGIVFVMQGYVPESRSESLRREIDDLAYVHFSPTPHRPGEEGPPTRLRNNWITEAFKPVTLIQGPPSYYEVDPTPFVSIFLCVFYGVMFADLGQGLVLTLLGLTLSFRSRGNLRLWGRLIMFLGASSAIAGFLIQEAFGFKLTPITGVKPILELIEHRGETATISSDAVIRLFTFAPFLGFIHVSIGLILSAYVLLRNGEIGEAIFSKIASLSMYVFGILLALAFVTTRGFEGLWVSSQPVPILGLPAGFVGTIGAFGALSSMAIMVGGRAVGFLIGLFPHGSLLGHLGAGMLEILENIIHFMSNTLSYLRISILMIIHVALMLLINSAWEALGPASIGILILGNIGVMGLEGLLVFIQALRLHLYEFFSKFFTGGGTLFKPLSFGSERVKVVFTK